jgi:calpain-5
MSVFGFFNSPVPYKGQKYSELKKQATESGHLFLDEEFAPNEKALFSSGGKAAGIEWKRPKDIHPDPHLFVDGASSHDLIQGELGNCWFVAACSCLAQDKDIWQKVIPDHKEQEWSDEEPDRYAGIFHFRFWRYGEWVDVVIDDFLPTRNGKLVYVHSKDKNEFWSALLEKAYAKLFGCYEALDGGELAEALEDFTGGVAEPLDLKAGPYSGDPLKQAELFDIMKKEMSYRALMAAAIPAKDSGEMEAETEIGLIIGHAYGITAVKRVALAGTGLFSMFNQEKISMVRLRNPWGGHEWKGAFSDGSPEWEKIAKNDREKIGLTFDDDGEFWMTFDDFMTHFTNMSICRVVNTSFFSLQKTWHEAVMHGEWKNPTRSGGCINNKDTVLNNPQYLFDVSEQEDEILVALTQKASRDANIPKATIGFTLMKVEVNRVYRVHRMMEIVKNSSFKNSRTIFERVKVPRGRYCLVASTFEPGKEAEHLLRIYTSSENNAKTVELDQPKKTALSDFCCCFPCCKYPVLVTSIKVLRAVGLERQDTVGGADPYVIIYSEQDKVQSHVVKDTTTPEWNFHAVFLRHSPNKPIKIDIYNSNLVRDTLLGRYVLSASSNMPDTLMEVELTNKDKSQKMPGKLFLQVACATDFLKL